MPLICRIHCSKNNVTIVFGYVRQISSCFTGGLFYSTVLQHGVTACAMTLTGIIDVYYTHSGPKNGLFLRVDNFATFKGRKVCDMSKFSEFCLVKV